jgi:nicotinamidase-related amidase
MFDRQSILSRLQAVAANYWDIPALDAQGVAFHMADWLDDLVTYVEFCREPDVMDDKAVSDMLLKFLIHVPPHVAAASKLYTGDPVIDVFGIEATSPEQPSLTEQTHPVNTALLVIDVQQGLCEGEHEAFESREVIARINKVSAKARAAGTVVIFVQHESKSGHLEFGTDAWLLARDLHVEPADLRIRKTTPDSFHRTELEEILRRHAVADLVICGMHTEFCVDTTTRRALALGYPVVLVADAHTTEGTQHLSATQIIRHHNDTLASISSFGPRVRAISTEDLRIGA